MDRPAIEKRAAAALGDKELLACGIVNCSDLTAAVDLEGKRRAEDRKPVRVVVRSINRVKHPAMRRPTCLGVFSEFLGQNRMLWKTLSDQLAKHRLDRHVGLG